MRDKPRGVRGNTEEEDPNLLPDVVVRKRSEKPRGPKNLGILLKPDAI